MNNATIVQEIEKDYRNQLYTRNLRLLEYFPFINEERTRVFPLPLGEKQHFSHQYEALSRFRR